MNKAYKKNMDRKIKEIRITTRVNHIMARICEAFKGLGYEKETGKATDSRPEYSVRVDVKQKLN